MILTVNGTVDVAPETAILEERKKKKKKRKQDNNDNVAHHWGKGIYDDSNVDTNAFCIDEECSNQEIPDNARLLIDWIEYSKL